MGIDEVCVGMLFEGKKDLVDGLCVNGCKVVMVGDGVNDVLVLVVVDVGIVMGMGVDVVVESVGLILLGGDLIGIVCVCKFVVVIMCNI